MKTLDEYIEERKARSPEFAAAWEASSPRFKLQRSLILARRGAGLTQKELADQVGTTQSAISRLETGDGNPSVELLLKLARALNVTFEITPANTIAARAVEVAD